MSIPAPMVYTKDPNKDPWHTEKVLEVWDYDDATLNFANSCCGCTILMDRDETLEMIRELVKHFRFEQADVFT